MRQQPVSINSHKTFICTGNQIFLYSRNQGDICAPFLGWKDHLYAKLLPAASCRSQDGSAQSERFQWVWLQASTARIWHLYHLSESGVRCRAPLVVDIHYRLVFRVTIAVGFFVSCTVMKRISVLQSQRMADRTLLPCFPRQLEY